MLAACPAEPSSQRDLVTDIARLSAALAGSNDNLRVSLAAGAELKLQLDVANQRCASLEAALADSRSSAHADVLLLRQAVAEAEAEPASAPTVALDDEEMDAQAVGDLNPTRPPDYYWDLAGLATSRRRPPQGAYRDFPSRSSSAPAQ